MTKKSLTIAFIISVFHIVNMSVLADVEAYTIATGHYPDNIISSPDIVADSNGYLHVVFIKYDSKVKVLFNSIPASNIKWDVYYSQSKDQGLTWTDARKIPECTGSTAYVVYPIMAIEAGRAIDIVWGEKVAAPGENSPYIYFCRSVDDGKSWTKPVKICHTPGVSPALAIGPNDSIHIVWNSAARTLDQKLIPQVAIDQFWNKNIYYTCSTNGGKTWDEKLLLPLHNIRKEPAAIAADPDGTVRICAADLLPDRKEPDIYYIEKSHGIWKKPFADRNRSMRPCRYGWPTYHSGSSEVVIFSNKTFTIHADYEKLTCETTH